MAADLDILDLTGPPRARGRKQGATFGPAIRAHHQAMLAAWSRSGLDDPAAYLDELIANTVFHTAIHEHLPHLADEMEGIAEGAGLESRTVYALQLIDEEWAYRVSRGQQARGLEKCSSFALRDTGGTVWIGQNMDLGAYTDGFQRVVCHGPAGGRCGALIVMLAGTLALLGVNDAGVGICVNSIPQVPSARHGIPVAFMIRHLLEQPSAAVAAERCRALPHATNQHYLIADAEHIFSLEASSKGVAEDGAGDTHRVLHSNHPLIGHPRYPEGEENSVARLRSLERRLSGSIDGPATLQAALSACDDPDHPVCRPRGDELGIIGFTTASMISALRRGPVAVECRISLGPPSERGYRPAQLSRDRTRMDVAW